MQQKARQIVLAVAALLIVGAACFGLFAVIRLVLQWLVALNSSLSVAIIAAAATFLVSTVSLVAGKLFESRMLLRKELREKKTPVYEDLIKLTIQVLMASKLEKPITDQELIEHMASINQRFMIWGSDDVVSAWVRFRRLAIDSAPIQAEPVPLMFLYEELVLAIRRDLGHKNKGLAKGSILALFLNDIDRHLRGAVIDR